MRIGENAPANCLLTTYRSVGFIFRFPGMVEGIQLNVVDRPFCGIRPIQAQSRRLKRASHLRLRAEDSKATNAGPPNGCPAFAQIKPTKINLSLFGRLLGALEGADHVDPIEGTIGGEVDDKRKAKGKHHGEHVAQRLDLNVKVQRWHLQDVGKALGQQAA